MMPAAQSPQWFSRQATVHGAQLDEQIVLVARQHPYRLLVGTWPVILGLLVLIVLLIGQASTLVPGALWGMAEILIGAVTLLMLVRWAVDDAYHWWNTLYSITDQRVIQSFHGVTQQDAEIPLNKIQATRVITSSIMHWLLGFGSVEIAGSAGQRIIFRDISAPRQVDVQIQAARDRARQVRQPTLAPLADPRIQHVLETLGAPEPMPAPMPLSADVSLAWPLSRAARVPLEQGEQQLGVISRHWWALVLRGRWALLVLAAAILCLWLSAALAVPLGMLTLALSVAGGIWGLLAYLDFADDVFILTTRRVIDVQRKYFVLFETDIAIEYTKIQVVDLAVTSAWARLLGYGNVIVKSSATPDKDWIRMEMVPHPKQIWDAIERSHTALKKRGDIQQANQRKDDLRTWFQEVMGEMVAVTPDLRGSTLTDAMALAQDQGLRVLVMGEALAIPNLPAGVVISQNPQPGARCLRGGDISVMLSRM